MKTYTAKMNVQRDHNNVVHNPGQAPATVITNVTAKPIPMAISTRLDTPRNGQQPRKYLKIKIIDDRCGDKNHYSQ
jgi:hypothetical protein